MSEELNNIEEEVVEPLEVAAEIEADVVEATEGVLSDSIVEEAPTQSPEELEAREKGWKPAEEFDDNTEGKNFVSAKEYLDRGRFYKTISTQGREIKELKTVINDFSGHIKRQEEAAYEKAKADIMAKQRQAVEHGDLESYDRLKEQASRIDHEAHTAKSKAPTLQDAGTKVAIDDFKERNKWFDPASGESKTIAMTAFAQAMSDRIAVAHPELSASESLSKIEDEVKRVYPDHFANSRQAAPAAVLPTKGNTVARKRGVSLKDLPQEFQQAGAKIIKMIPGYTEERYIKELIDQGVISNDK